MTGGHEGKSWRRSAHVPALLALQLLFIVIFAIFVVYDPNELQHGKGTKANAAKSFGNYAMYQDVHVMVFVGVGFLMVFLKKYGLSAVSLNMLLAALSLQWAIIVNGFFHLHHSKHGHHHDDHGNHSSGHHHKEVEDDDYSYGRIHLNVAAGLLVSDVTAASVVISFGVVIGTTSVFQLILMALLEVVVFVANEVIGKKFLMAVDAGDTIFLHLFAAYFGLFVSRALGNTHKLNNAKKGADYTSDKLAMVGTIFLWVFWLSFNAAGASTEEGRQRAIVNTLLALTASVVVSFSVSALVNPENKFVMEHVQNSTLAGGVAMGAAADLYVGPAGALVVGALAGAISVLGYHYLTPFLSERFDMSDTCGVHNLHGLPAVLGTLVSALAAHFTASKEYYGDAWATVYPADPSQLSQAARQLLAGVMTVVSAAIGGSITGQIMRFVGFWQSLDNEEGSRVALPKDAFYDDHFFVEVEDEEHHEHDKKHEV